jgi:23S rRNA pseudouridine1911/1915/1917 synthase
MGIFPKDRDLTQAPKEVELRVDASDLRQRAENVELRLDAFLVLHLTWRSRNSIQELIRAGQVLVDASTPDHPRGTGVAAVEKRPGRWLRNGSRVVVLIPEHLRLPTTGPVSDDLSILYEDDGILAVDKPPFVSVHPGGRHLVDTLIQRVHARYGAGFDLERGGAPRLCHRLDRETSGIVLVGKNPIAHADVMQQFERRLVEKEYLAIVRGSPETDGGVIEYPIASARASSVELKMAVVADGQPSETEWRVVERRRHVALVSCRPKTGRQHQIRVHLEAIGHPVVGDKLYGHDEALFQKSLDGRLTKEDLRTLGMPRQALHNHRVVFKSPATKERVEVVSPIAPDMASYFEGQEPI